MVRVDEAVIARLKKAGHTFEILVDCDKALDFKAGKSAPLDDVLASDIISKDAKKGEKIADSTLQEVFKTTDYREIASVIIKEGEVQLTAKHRAAQREEKIKKIIHLIHRNAIDSRTGFPHPPQRIEAALKEAKVHIDDFKSAEEQLDDVIKKVRLIIPLKFEVRELAVKIPAQYAGACYGNLKRYKLIKDEWQNDGSLVAVLEIPAGIQEDLLSELNKIAHGEVESKIVRVL